MAQELRKDLGKVRQYLGFAEGDVIGVVFKNAAPSMATGNDDKPIEYHGAETIAGAVSDEDRGCGSRHRCHEVALEFRGLESAAVVDIDLGIVAEHRNGHRAAEQRPIDLQEVSVVRRIDASTDDG